MTGQRDGGCLCGAVRYEIATDKTILGACSCEQCRRHTGSLLVGLAVQAEDVRWSGEIAVYRSSDWAERGFCPNCGSSLFYRVVAGQMIGLTSVAAGTFDSLDGLSLGHEFFSDDCPAYRLEGTHARMTRAETIAKFAGTETST